MPSTISLSLETALLLIGLVLMVYALEVLIFWWKSSRTLARRVHDDDLLMRMRQELERQGVRLVELESRIQQLTSSESSELEEMPTGSTETPYALAIRLVREGADIDDIQRNCGLSRAEADLIVAIYRGVI